MDNEILNSISLKSSLNKIIKKIEIDDKYAYIHFDDLSIFCIHDDGQCCCEKRYMTCDDDLKSFENTKFLGIEIKEGPNQEHWGVHEVQFLEIKTSKGYISIANHNEHDGYYSGFSIECFLE
jgi:hypothetical protein